MLSTNHSLYLYHTKYIQHETTATTSLVYLFFSNMGMNIPKGFRKSKMYKFNLDGNHLREFIKSLTSKGLFSKIRSSLVKAFMLFLNYTNKISPRKSLMFSDLLDIIELSWKIVTPTFKFTFHLIDKKIRKFSRGKSGKYRLSLNYLPPFKRMKYVFKVLKKNIKIFRDNTLDSRMFEMFKITLLKKKLNLLQRFDKFSNMQVYHNNRVKVLKLSN